MEVNRSNNKNKSSNIDTIGISTIDTINATIICCSRKSSSSRNNSNSRNSSSSSRWRRGKRS